MAPYQKNLAHIKITQTPQTYIQYFASNALSLTLPLFIVSSRPIQLSGVNLLVKSSRDAEHLFISRELIPRYVSARARTKGNFIAETFMMRTHWVRRARGSSCNWLPCLEFPFAD